MSDSRRTACQSSSTSDQAGYSLAAASATHSQITTKTSIALLETSQSVSVVILRP
ncbi:hypothetical protein ACIQVE_27025 [Pseudomonas sp. NPDC098747]|uniref:hypothetical protein n=1 Tax=Pseudomonas sp. NPDC098747 TaxID=3364487 RepID=UPI00383AB0E2